MDNLGGYVAFSLICPNTEKIKGDMQIQDVNAILSTLSQSLQFP